MIRKTNLFIACGCIALAITSGARHARAAGIDIQAAGAAIGIETGKRWCNGEDSMEAIERSMFAYFAESKYSLTELSDEDGERMGEEVALEGFAYAFRNCPTRAKMIFRNMSN